MTAVNDDMSGADFWGVITYDGDGVPIAADWAGPPIPSQVARTNLFGPSAPGEPQINAMTARPLTIEVYDIVTLPPSGWNRQDIYDDIVGQGSPLLGTLVVDQADFHPDCASLPWAIFTDGFESGDTDAWSNNPVP